MTTCAGEITAVDTNILLDILLPNEQFLDASASAPQASASAGALVICDIVYAELCIHFTSQNDCDEFLDLGDIQVQPLTRPAHFLASRVWRIYRQRGGARAKILADFLIGAHAQVQASQLLSRDRGFYRTRFPSLTFYDPAKP